MTDAPAYRTQKLHWFVEIGTCDGCGMGRWESTTESVSCETKEAADILCDEWIASGKLKKMHWGGLRPTKGGYGMFRIRAEWIDTDLSADLVRSALEAAALSAYSSEIYSTRRDIGNKIRTLAVDPVEIARIVAQVMEKEHG